MFVEITLGIVVDILAQAAFVAVLPSLEALRSSHKTSHHVQLFDHTWDMNTSAVARKIAVAAQITWYRRFRRTADPQGSARYTWDIQMSAAAQNLPITFYSYYKVD